MTKTSRSIFASLAFWSLAALVAGLGLGILGYAGGSPFIASLASTVQPLGALWLRALRLVVLPLVVVQLLTAITGHPEGQGFGRVGGRALAAIAVGSVAMMLAALCLGWPLVQLFHLSPETVETIRNSVVVPVELGGYSATPVPFGVWLTGLIPANIAEAFLNDQVIQILLVTVAFGLAVNQLALEQRKPLSVFFSALNDTVLIVIRWILWATPVGVFALMLGLALGTGLETAEVVVGWVFLNQGIQLILVLGLYPVAVFIGKTTLSKFVRAAAPAQLVAVSTRSSLATLPAQIEGGRQHLEFGKTTTGVVVPLCVSFFKITLLISDPVRLLFLAHVFGVALSPGQIASFLFTVLLINFTELGLPRGGVPFRTLPAYLAVGIPIEGLILLQALNDLEDYADTVANATGMFAAATVLSRHDRLGSGPAGELG